MTHWPKRAAARARGPFAVGLAVAFAFIAAGFAAVALSWHGTARTLHIPLQIPYVISGSLGAIGLIGVGAVLLNVLFERKADAAMASALDEMIDGAAGLLSGYTRPGSKSRVSE